MEMNEYQGLAQRTANTDLDKGQRLANGALGLAGEAGEAADLIKKHLYHGHGLNTEKLKSELGDILWYVATLSRTLGLDLDEIATQNVAKLRARYPEGFSSEHSINRVGE